MFKHSAGLVVYRYYKKELQVLLVHPGGPFYIKKDEGVWSIPKGEYDDDEDALTVAKRELNEETGNTIDDDLNYKALHTVKIKSGKIITAWAVEANFKMPFITSNNFEMEWPPRSGKQVSFAEVDKAEYFDIPTAKKKILAGQLPFLSQLCELLNEDF